MSDDWKRIPPPEVAALIVQTAAALIWAGAASARIAALETGVGSQGAVAERLARLEEQGVATRQAVERIERRLEGGR